MQPVEPDVLVATVKALLRLRRAEEKYRSIFENAVEGIFRASIEGRLLAANPIYIRMRLEIVRFRCLSKTPVSGTAIC